MKQFLPVPSAGLLAAALALFIGGCASTSLNEAPITVNDPVLDYPPGAIMRLEEGVVLVRFRVDENGSTSDYSLRQSSGSPILDEEGMAFVRRLECQPAMIRGKAVASWVDQKVVFTIFKSYTDPLEWSRTTHDLVRRLESSAEAERPMVEKLLYKQCGDYMSSILTQPNLVLSRYALDLAGDPVRSRWAAYANTFPMSFLMFDDFLQRQKTSRLAERARSQLSYALEADISRIENRLTEDPDPALRQLHADMKAYLQAIINANPA